MLWVLIKIAEAILMSTHNIGFYEDLTKIIFQIHVSSNIIRICTLSLLLIADMPEDFHSSCMFLYQICGKPHQYSSGSGDPTRSITSHPATHQGTQVRATVC